MTIKLIKLMIPPRGIPPPAGFPSLIKLQSVREGEALSLSPAVVQAPPGVAVGTNYYFAT